MILGLNTFAGDTFARGSPNIEPLPHFEWEEICPSTDVWTEIPVDDSIIVRCN